MTYQRPATRCDLLYAQTSQLNLCSVERFPENPCLGYRPIKYGEPGPYKWQTYKEIGENVDAIAGGITHLGHKAHGRIGVYGINSPEWMIAMQVRHPSPIHSPLVS